MIRRILLAGAASCMFAPSALAANAACPVVGLTQLQNALKLAIQRNGAGGGLALGLNMWATVVAPDGRVCVVANSSGDAIQGQWLASRAISAQKAFTAATLSLGPTPNSGSGTGLAAGKLALSTANLYSAVQPGGSLFGLQHSNPVAAAGAYGDRISPAGLYIGPADTATYGTANDPMIGQVVGGINVFGGGLGLYTNAGVKVGGIGVSGDSSCADHMIAWRVRRTLDLDHLATVGGVGKTADNIRFDIDPATGVSASGWGQPSCLGVPNAAAQTFADNLAAAIPPQP